MFRTAAVFLSLIALLSCGEPPDTGTPKGAFAMIGPCIDAVDRQCFFRTLDQESRWSLCTIHRTLVDIRKLVEKSYPVSARDSAYGMFKAEAGAKTPEEMFEIFCDKRKCLERVARGYGAVQTVRKTGTDRVEITTSRGATFAMAQAEGRWGLDIFGDELQKTKLRMIDRLEQVKENARQYEAQRLAREAD